MTTQNVFERYVRDNWNLRNATPDRSLAIMGLGCAGEAGEVAEHIKKTIRDYGSNVDSYPPDKRHKLLLELGDVLHYLTVITHTYGYTLDEVMTQNITKLNERYGRKS